MAFGPVLELSSLDGTNGFQISGETQLDESGFSVASAGDINGNGFADVVIGAVRGGPNTGASYVVFGRAGGFAAELDLFTLNGRSGFQISGEKTRALAARSVRPGTSTATVSTI